MLLSRKGRYPKLGYLKFEGFTYLIWHFYYFSLTFTDRILEYAMFSDTQYATNLS